MVRRSQSYPHGAVTPSTVQTTQSNSQGSNASSQSSNHLGFSRPHENLSNPPALCQPVDTSGDNTSSNFSSNSGTNKNRCISPSANLPVSSSCDFVKPGSPVQLQGQGHFTSFPGSAGGRDGSLFHKMDKHQPSANFGIKSFQQQQQQSHHQAHHQEAR